MMERNWVRYLVKTDCHVFLPCSSAHLLARGYRPTFAGLLPGGIASEMPSSSSSPRSWSPSMPRRQSNSARRSSDVNDAVISAAAAATSARVMHASFLYKRGSYTWNLKQVKLYEDGTLTIAASNQQKIKHVLVVKGAFAVAEARPKGGMSGWRLSGCKWSGAEEPDFGLELASETYAGAQQWLLALRQVGVTCSEDVDYQYELPRDDRQTGRALTPPRALTRSASRALQIAQPQRYTGALRSQAADELLPDDIVFGACRNCGTCCLQLTRDSERCCYRRGFTSPRGLRALIRLIDGAAVACLCANVSTLNNFADVLLACAMLLLGTAATLAVLTVAYSECGHTTPGPNPAPNPPVAPPGPASTHRGVCDRGERNHHRVYCSTRACVAPPHAPSPPPTMALA